MKHQLFIISILLLLTFSGCTKLQNDTTSPQLNVEEVTDASTLDTNEYDKIVISTQIKNQTNTPKTAAELVDNEATPESTYIMDVPQFSYYTSSQIDIDTTPSITLDLNTQKPNKITDYDKWFQENNLTLNQCEFMDATRYNLPSKIPIKYENLILTNAFYDDAYIYCTYGTNNWNSHILRIYDAKSYDIFRTIDFSNYMFAPNTTDKDALEYPQEINFASIDKGILYVSNSHGTYAKTTNYQNAYITAIDLKDMNVLWRSDPLICNAKNFLIVENVILCGYGFTDEDDYLYLLSKDNGKVFHSIPLKTAPSYFIRKENQIFVRTYDTDYVFEIVTK